MADKLKAGGLPFADRLRDAHKRLADVKKHKEKAAEYTGLAGKATRDIAERCGVHTWAITAVSTLTKREPTEQQSRFWDFVGLAIEAGVLDQVDAFDDRAKLVRDKIVAALDRDPAPAPASSVVSMIGQGAPAH